MLVMNASTMATSSRVMASPEAMQLLSTAPLSQCMMGSKQRRKKAISRGSTAGGTYRVVTECRVVDAGEDEEHPPPRVHYGVSEAQGLRMKRFNLGRPLVDESEHCSPHFVGFLWRTRCVVDAVQSRRHG